MLSHLHANGIVRLADWETPSSFQWILLTTAANDAFVATSVVVEELLGFELTDGSYARQAVTGTSITYPDPGSGPLMQADAGDPTFPALAGGEIVGWLVCAYDTGTDASDEILASFQVNHEADGTDFIPTISSLGVVRIGDGYTTFINGTET